MVTFQQSEPTFDVPVTLRLRYRSGEVETTVVPVTEALTEARLPLKGELRDVSVEENHALGDVRR